MKAKLLRKIRKRIAIQYNGLEYRAVYKNTLFSDGCNTIWRNDKQESVIDAKILTVRIAYLKTNFKKVKK